MKKWRLIAVCTILAGTLMPQTAYAAEYQIIQEESDQGIIYKLTYSETISGEVTEADLVQELEYDGLVYHLTGADIEYHYGAYGERLPERDMTETIPLSSDSTAQIPKYRNEGNTAYILDESSISVQVTGYTDETGAEPVETTVTLEDLPDNDLSRIPLTTEYDGLTCDLLYVTYTVMGTDDNGTPTSYRADCRYGALKEYTESFPSSWQATVHYAAYEGQAYIRSSTVNYQYEYVEVPEIPEEEPEPEEPEEPVAEEPVAEEPIEEQKPFPIIPVAAASGTGVVLALILYFLFLTAPIYALTSAGKYRFIGRIRMKHRKDCYEAKLTESLADRAEVQSYKIKVPAKVRKQSTTGILRVKCPDGEILTPKLREETIFTIR